MVRLSDQGLKNGASRLALAVGLALTVPAVLPMQPAVAQVTQIQMGTSFDCARAGTAQSVPSLVCQTPELQFADLHQLQAYYTLRHAQPERQQELRNQFTARIQALVRECSTEQVRASGSQAACVTQALGNLRNFWLEQLQQAGNAAALEEARLPSGNLVGAQQALKTSGFLPANAVVDGVYGSGTREAIARLQAERGIAANGFLTQPTLVALRRASIAGATTSGTPAGAGSTAAPTAPTAAGGTSAPAAQQQRTAPPPQIAQVQPIQRPQEAVGSVPVDASTRALLAEADRAQIRRDYVAALRIYRTLADRGVAEAQVELGAMYSMGLAVDINNVEALRLTRLAIRQEHMPAYVQLANLHILGWGVEINHAEALRLCRIAAERGDGAGQACLGTLHLEGVGVRRNAGEALRLLGLSAAQGDSSGQTALASLYFRGVGVQRNSHEAIRLYRMAAEQGSGTAQIMLGAMHMEGRGVARDANEGRRLFDLARPSYGKRQEWFNIDYVSAARTIYDQREKNVLEQVMNYSTTSRELGTNESFWISGWGGTHRCVLTRFEVGLFSGLMGAFAAVLGGGDINVVDIREFNERGFRVWSERGRPTTFGDESRRLPASSDAVMQRMLDAWGLAFRECPGRRSAF